MPNTAARIAISARRNELARFTIAVTGIDLTGVAMAMQVRPTVDNPVLLFALGNVNTIAAEGLKLDSVTVTNGVPTSIIKGRINASTMLDKDKVPYVGEIGTDSTLAYAMQWTLNGDPQTRLYGDFVVLASAFGSDGAPASRPPSYGGGSNATGSSSGSLTFGDQVVQVSINGVEIVGALVGQATQAKTDAEIARDKAKDWAEGTGEPGGAATKSAKAWAGAARDQVLSATPLTALLSLLEYRRAYPSKDNLLDVSTLSPGIPHQSDGAVDPGDSDYVATDYLPVSPSKGVMANRPLSWVAGFGTIAFYAADRSYLSSLTVAPGAVTSNTIPAYVAIIPPAGASYVRFAIPAAQANRQGFKVWAGVQADEPVGSFAALARTDDAALIAALAIRSTLPVVPNLFNKESATLDRIVLTGSNPGLGAVGTLYNSSAFGAGKYFASDWINVAAYRGQSITITNWNTADQERGFGLAFADARFQPGDLTANAGWTSISANLTITVPSYATWMRVSGLGVSIATMMVVPGAAAPAGYVAFGGGSSSASLPLFGKKVGFFGDSISGSFGQAWQNAFLGRTGAVGWRQDARSARTWSAMLEAYGAKKPLANLSALGTYNSANTCGDIDEGSTIGQYAHNYQYPEDGTTLAQWLAPLDLVIIWLGTNDASRLPSHPVGVPGDGYTAGTVCGDIAFALDAIEINKPAGMPVRLITNAYTRNWGGDAAIAATASAIVAMGKRYGMPVLNGLEEFGINSITCTSMLKDDSGIVPNARIHPNPATMAQLGGRIGSWAISKA